MQAVVAEPSSLLGDLAFEVIFGSVSSKKVLVIGSVLWEDVRAACLVDSFQVAVVPFLQHSK
jgi:predicted HAD superfamily phosphohydrolase YqeG